MDTCTNTQRKSLFSSLFVMENDNFMEMYGSDVDRDEDPTFFSTDPDPAGKKYGSGSDL